MDTVIEPLSEMLMETPLDSLFLKYSATNESLEAINAGLRLTPKDTAVMVAGCGDQPFSALESGAKVHAVDCDHYQISLVEHRLCALAGLDYAMFLKATKHCKVQDLWRRNSYFEEEGRMEAISGNIGNIELHRMGVLDAILELNPTKIYLSNIIGFVHKDLGTERSIPKMIKDFKKVAGYMKPQAVLYIANVHHFEGELDENTVKDAGLEFLAEESFIARQYEKENYTTWVPGVYRKLS